MKYSFRLNRKIKLKLKFVLGEKRGVARINLGWRLKLGSGKVQTFADSRQPQFICWIGNFFPRGGKMVVCWKKWRRLKMGKNVLQLFFALLSFFLLTHESRMIFFRGASKVLMGKKLHLGNIWAWARAWGEASMGFWQDCCGWEQMIACLISLNEFMFYSAAGLAQKMWGEGTVRWIFIVL